MRRKHLGRVIHDAPSNTADRPRRVAPMTMESIRAAFQPAGAPRPIDKSRLDEIRRARDVVLPADYVDLVTTWGIGGFDQWIEVGLPELSTSIVDRGPGRLLGTVIPHFMDMPMGDADLRAFGEEGVRMHPSLRESDAYPVTYAKTLLPWGRIGSGEQFCFWRVDEGVTTGVATLIPWGVGDYHEYDMSMTDFIIDVLVNAPASYVVPAEVSDQQGHWFEPTG
jgi:hypothetical protein